MSILQAKKNYPWSKQNKFFYSILVKGFEKQIKTIEDQGKEEVEFSKVIKPEENKEMN